MVAKLGNLEAEYIIGAYCPVLSPLIFVAEDPCELQEILGVDKNKNKNKNDAHHFRVAGSTQEGSVVFNDLPIYFPDSMVNLLASVVKGEAKGKKAIAIELFSDLDGKVISNKKVYCMNIRLKSTASEIKQSVLHALAPLWGRRCMST